MPSIPSSWTIFVISISKLLVLAFGAAVLEQQRFRNTSDIRIIFRPCVCSARNFNVRRKTNNEKRDAAISTAFSTILPQIHYYWILLSALILENPDCNCRELRLLPNKRKFLAVCHKELKAAKNSNSQSPFVQALWQFSAATTALLSPSCPPPKPYNCDLLLLLLKLSLHFIKYAGYSLSETSESCFTTATTPGKTANGLSADDC